MDIESAITNLEGTKATLNGVSLAIMQAAGGRFYYLDLLALASVNRTLHLMPAFVNAVESRNFFVAAPILRMHLDTCLRLSAAWQVDEPHKYASALLDGTPTSKLKDSAKQKMTDKYLVRKLSVKYPWMTSVYDTCSGFVHLSSSHFSPMIKLDGTLAEAKEAGGTFEMGIGLGTVRVAEEQYLEGVMGFNFITGVLQELLEGWLFTKDNADIVARLKANCIATGQAVPFPFR